MDSFCGGYSIIVKIINCVSNIAITAFVDSRGICNYNTYYTDMIYIFEVNDMTDILCFGDSNTYGYIPGGSGRFDSHTRYTGVLQSLLGSRYRVFEDGFCGRTTIFDRSTRQKCGSDVIAEAADKYRPDILTVMLGTNDCKAAFHASAEDIADGMLKLADKALQNVPDAKVIFIAPPEIKPCAIELADYYLPHSLEVSAEIPNAYRAAAESRGFGFLNGAEYTVTDGADGEHLSAENHTLLARELAKLIQSI